MVRIFRSVPHTGAVSEPEPRPLRLLLWHLEALLTPDPLDALGVDTPPFVAQDGSDPQVPGPAIFLASPTIWSRKTSSSLSRLVT